ncbi:carbonate dehydratase [Piscirickettsia salmonis]|nr:HAD-IC family P-type ATPase [Piscirickettsia salmonis]APS45766.1 carbonate dehydratase [Piscirickettsia salmonis]APS49012.1 carbonate dehydratase [Piscirickettsia salmonis]APS52292.1 carbonate dehydratase [Piscirickettsia salmonis]APS55511.1 carbonate dehydratase [Piscirickettsia salmonis]QHS32683.1 HAD-IC family P-type ATPase [Piscirickettsia salmonis]
MCKIPTEVATLTHFKSHTETGLSESQVEDYKKCYGPNLLTPRKGKSPFVRFLLHFHQPLVYILLAAGTVTLFLGEYVDSSVIFAVVLVNSIVGYLQENKALHALAALSRIMTTEARVIRQGKTRELPAAELVPGDIVLLLSGDKVPADLRLLEARDLRIDESALTGESVPVSKCVEVLNEKTILAERKNMAYASTLVTYGRCKGVVTAIGDETEIGRISTLMSQTHEIDTPLTRKIASFSRLLLYLILALALATFAAGMIQQEPLTEMFLAAVALAVAAIPEGLPAAFTIILAIGVSRMARKGAIIRKLPAVETLGSTTIVCSDKTGTLTKNQMTVQEVVVGQERYTISGAGYEPVGTVKNSAGQEISDINDELKECLLAGLLCNNAILVQKEGCWQIEGDPTEGALIVAAGKVGLSEVNYRQAMPCISTIPFESEYKYMATLHQISQGQTAVVYIKGAVEIVLERCSPNSVNQEQIKQEMQRLASKSMRVLAFAKVEVAIDQLEINHQDLMSNLTFLGLQGMIDPPREEAIVTIKQCHQAGVRVAMITGDHAVTAGAIAQQMGLSEAEAVVITGADIDEMDDRRLENTVQSASVYARISPEQKLRLVRSLQQQGHVAAMTGDGVNDAPALKQADIVVAMGLCGTEVAKEAGDMILTDDNFSTIGRAVEEGRCVFDNLTKFIVWTMPTNMGEGLIVLTAIFTGFTLPVLPAHILWINMTTALMLGMMLAFETKEGDIMSRSPRNPRAPILNKALMLRIAMVSLIMLAMTYCIFIWETHQGASIQEARTTTVNVIVMCELFYLFNCRSLNRSMFDIGVFSNVWVLVGVVGMVLLQLAFTYLPAFNYLFNTTSIGWQSWLWSVMAGLLVYLVVGFEKWLRQNVSFLSLATSS